MTDLATQPNGADIIERVIAAGDLAKLSAEERTRYYGAVCSSLGLNPLTKPFEFLSLSGRLVLYATRGATDQLRRIHHVSTTILSRETVGDVYVVTARATDRSGRSDESIGAVTIAGKRGDDLCNALMKAETKAKRRATLAIVGLSFLDESEVETIPGARALEEPDPGPSPKMAALRAELENPLGDEPIPTTLEPEQMAGEPDDLLHTPGYQVKRAEAQELYERCRAAGMRPAQMHPQATEAGLEAAIAGYRRMLRGKGLEV